MKSCFSHLIKKIAYAMIPTEWLQVLEWLCLCPVTQLDYIYNGKTVNYDKSMYNNYNNKIQCLSYYLFQYGWAICHPVYLQQR